MDEPTKLAIIGFNITVLVFQFVFNMGYFGFPFAWWKLGLAVVLGAVVGGGIYAATRSK